MNLSNNWNFLIFPFIGLMIGFFGTTLYLKKPVEHVRAIEKKDFASRLGDVFTKSPAGVIINAPVGHKPGFVLFGPYWGLKAGSYIGRMGLQLRLTDMSESPVCTTDIFANGVIFASRDIPINHYNGKFVELPFKVAANDKDKKFEFRLQCNGSAEVTVRTAAFVRLE